MPDLRSTAEHVIERARKDGATAADVLIREDDSFSVAVRMGEVETVKQAISRQLMLRVFVGKRTAASQNSDLTPKIVNALVDETVELARLTSEDESAGIDRQVVLMNGFAVLSILYVYLEH